MRVCGRINQHIATLDIQPHVMKEGLVSLEPLNYLQLCRVSALHFQQRFVTEAHALKLLGD
jgi:hypothetical protein